MALLEPPVKLWVELSRGAFDGLGRGRERHLEGLWNKTRTREVPQWRRRESGRSRQLVIALVGVRDWKNCLGAAKWGTRLPASHVSLGEWPRGHQHWDLPARLRSRNPRGTANRRHRRWTFLIYFACVHCAPAHFIRRSACHFPWNVYLPLTGRMTVFQERRKEPLGNFTVNEWGRSVAVMRRLSEGETIISGKLCFE